MDLDLRRLRYFTTVATELSFVRAAGRLHMTQPALSRQIRALEDDLGVLLLRRGPIGTALTRAGHQLLKDARPLLAAAVAAQRRAHLAAHEKSQFTVGLPPGVIITPIVRRFKALARDVTVEVLHTAITGQADHLTSGAVDVCFVRLPLPDDTLETVPLFPEPRVAALAGDHPLAQAESLHIDTLAGYPLLQDPDEVPEWRSGLRRSGTGPAGARLEQHPAGIDQSLEAVASGDGFAVFPAGIPLFYRRPDVRYIRLDGVAPRTVALAYRRHHARPEIDVFARIALAELAPPAGPALLSVRQ
ncbi:LysR family transcriptional regulator [Actinoplanes subtropicus]|uniref:LysR family transcriptional regulator n=1 Tax=Actinoplanes subtropicus TaxID=543632 RepID=UPI0004C33507|nr:LysR family transcriptional regulator [Actinoplanes subtropicus]